MRQLHAENRSLDFVQPKISTDEFVMVTRLHSMLATMRNRFANVSSRQTVTPGIVSGPEIFGLIKTEATGIAHCAGFAP
jgi:hypothetical protein